MAEFDFETGVASSEWLTEVLGQNGYLESGSVVSVSQETSPFDVGASATLHGLTLTYSEDSQGARPTSLLMKVAMSGQTEGFEDILVRYSAWLFSPQSSRYEILRKEPMFYDTVRSVDEELPLFKCFGTATDPVNHFTCLLLEDISDTHGQPPWPIPPDDKQCEASITSLAKVHAQWWNSKTFGTEDFPSITAGLVSEVLDIYGDAYLEFKEDLGDRLSGPRRTVYERALDKLPSLLNQRLVDSAHLTLIHGDAHHWNILLPKLTGDAVIFDWQTWHVDVGAHDLAYQMAMGWFPDRRARLEQRLLRHYIGELSARGVRYEWDQLTYDYRLSIVRHLFTPVIYSSFITPAVWWDHLERIFCAFNDWQCGELLA